MLIPSTITARRTRRYTSTWYIHPTTHKHDFEPMDGGGRSSFQPPQVRQPIRPGGPLYLRLLQPTWLTRSFQCPRRGGSDWLRHRWCWPTAPPQLPRRRRRSCGADGRGSHGPVRRRPPCDRPPAGARLGCVFSPLSPLGWEKMGHPAPESASVAHRGAGTALLTLGATPAPGGPQQELGHLGAATSGWTGGCFPPGALPGAISGGLLPLGGPLCVSVQTITVGRALRELRPRRPPQPLPCLTCPSPSPTTRFSYHTNRRCSIRCHMVVAVLLQGSKGRPAHAVASTGAS